MKATLEVVSQKEYDDWVKEQSTSALKLTQPPAAAPAAASAAK